jgi:hypothetical protein
MIMKYVLLSILTTIALSTFAQQEKAVLKPKWKYTGIVQGGLIGGSSELNYTAQTIQGIQKGPWLLGIGAGIDNYVVPGIPVVAHGQFNYGKKRAKPFVYAQGGPQIPWAKNQWNDQILGVDQYEMKTGWLAEGGIGYSFPMGKHLKLISSLGYSTKLAKYDEVKMPWSWFLSSRWPPEGGNPDFTYYHQKLTMNRLVLKVGVQF